MRRMIPALKIAIILGLVATFGCQFKNSASKPYKYENPESGKEVALREAESPRPLVQRNAPAAPRQSVELVDATIQLDRTSKTVTCKVTRNLYDQAGTLRSTERVELRGQFVSEAPAKLRDVEAAKFGGPRLLGFAECVPDRFGQQCATLFVNVIYDSKRNYKQFHAVFPGRPSAPSATARGSSAGSTSSRRDNLPPGSVTSGSPSASGASASAPPPPPPAAPDIVSAEGVLATKDPVLEVDDDIYDPIEVIKVEEGTKRPAAPQEEIELPEGDTHTQDGGSGTFISNFPTAEWEEADKILGNPYDTPAPASGSTTGGAGNGGNGRGQTGNGNPQGPRGGATGQPGKTGTTGGQSGTSGGATTGGQAGNGGSATGGAAGAPTSGQSGAPQTGSNGPTREQVPAVIGNGQPQTTKGIPLKLTGGGTAVNSHENGRIDQVGTLFPANTTGAVRVSAENRGYGNGFGVDFVSQTARAFTMANPECGALTINQISKPNGGPIYSGRRKVHATHYTGLDFDISYFGTPWTDYVYTERQRQRGRRNGRTRVVNVERMYNNRDFKYDCFLKYTKFIYEQKFANIDSQNNGIEIVDLIWVNRAIQNGVCDYVKRNNLKNEYEDALSLIYPEDGHGSHFHLRLRCSPKHNGCYTRDFDRQLPFRKRGCRNL